MIVMHLKRTACRKLVHFDWLCIVCTRESDHSDDPLDETSKLGLTGAGKGGKGGAAGVVDLVAIFVEDLFFGKLEGFQPWLQVGGGEEVIVLGDEGMDGEQGGVGDGSVVGVEKVSRGVVQRV